MGTNTYPNRRSYRLKGYDYSLSGNYFVTIVTNKRDNMFGDTDSGTLILNGAGLMVDDVCRNIYTYNSSIMINDIAIMPNHIHCIITITANGATSLQDIVRYIKSKTTVEYVRGIKEKGWRNFEGKLWQPRYYDHVIRTQRAYDMIRDYIYHNPERWNSDSLNPLCGNDADDIERAIKEYEGR